MGNSYFFGILPKISLRRALDQALGTAILTDSPDPEDSWDLKDKRDLEDTRDWRDLNDKRDSRDFRDSFVGVVGFVIIVDVVGCFVILGESSWLRPET